MRRFGVLGDVERDDVGVFEQRFVVDRGHAKLGEAGGGDVRVVGENAHVEGAQPPRHLRADAAEADDADGAALQIDRAATDLRGQPPARVALSATTSWRVTASSRAIVCSAAEMALAPGALRTSTPARVAASRSMLSTPTPARATTRRFGAAASTSAVTSVSLRTTRASASRTAASSAGTFRPVDVDDAGGGGEAFAGCRVDGVADDDERARLVCSPVASVVARVDRCVVHGVCPSAGDVLRR